MARNEVQPRRTLIAGREIKEEENTDNEATGEKGVAAGPGAGGAGHAKSGFPAAALRFLGPQFAPPLGEAEKSKRGISKNQRKRTPPEKGFPLGLAPAAPAMRSLDFGGSTSISRPPIRATLTRGRENRKANIAENPE